MNFEELIKLGFNKNEAKVYLSLVKFGKADANQLIKDTKFHKNIVYDNLEKLIDKGLVTFIIEEGRKVFQAAPPDMIIQLFEDQEKELAARKKLAETIAEDIRKAVKKVPFKQTAVIYRGIKGIKAYHAEVLHSGKNYTLFGAPKQSIDIMGEHFWKNFELKRIENKIHVKMIFNPSLRNFGESLKNQHTVIRYFERDFEPLTQTDVHEDKVAIIVWSDPPVIFLIQDKLVANSYGEFFERMWKQATP